MPCYTEEFFWEMPLNLGEIEENKTQMFSSRSERELVLLFLSVLYLVR